MNIIETVWAGSGQESTLARPTPWLEVCFGPGMTAQGYARHIDGTFYVLIDDRLAENNHIVFDVSKVVWAGLRSRAFR